MGSTLLQKGFSFIELLATISVGSILMLITMPISKEILGSYQRQTAMVRIAQDLEFARNEAFTRGSLIDFNINNDGKSYSISQSNQSVASLKKSISVIRKYKLPNELRILPIQTISFDSRGFLVDRDLQPTTTSFTLLEQETAFLNATILASGIIDY